RIPSYGSFERLPVLTRSETYMCPRDGWTKLTDGLYGAEQRGDRLDAVNLGLVEPDLGKIDSVFLFQKDNQFHRIDGTEAAAEKKGSAVSERLPVVPDGEQAFEEFANFNHAIHDVLRDLN